MNERQINNCFIDELFFVIKSLTCKADVLNFKQKINLKV